tara:strand:- start:686 stop:868 length:183 start_codon:yes stop_codon:yes gene_type:complete
MVYWVIGGKYTDTSFNKIEDGCEIEKYGPFDDHEEARKIWDYHSWKNVDDCFIRFTIIKD